jgi:hypothetical protein
LLEAIQLGTADHYNDECIISASIDHYEHTLMQDDKRNILTRIKLITMMSNKTIIFLNHRLKVRMFDAFTENMIYKYNPVYTDFHAKPFVCMV